MKKIIAAIMAAATFVSAISFSAFAADINFADSGNNPFETKAFPLGAIVDPGDQFGDVVRPEITMYVPIPHIDMGGGKFLDDSNYFTVSAKAVEGSKYVKKISRASKSWDDVVISTLGYTFLGRFETIKIELKPSYIDEEHKVQFEFSVKGKSKSGYTGTAKGTTPFFYINNEVVGYDSYVAGQKGLVYKPVKNEENEVIWNDEIRDIARLTFIADSDVAKAYPKLNTKWDNADYAEYFSAQDAFLFDFVSNPYISSTSRAVLEIYNPYYNIDTDEVTVDGADVVIYEVTEDGFIDVTDQFTYGENEDGDLVFTTKTRRLGTYIFAEQEVDTADVTEPDVTTPDVKPVPDTGR